MKHRNTHTKNNRKQTVAWLMQAIDRELAHGENADKAFILECIEYLQELSPETAVPALVTEKHLQKELGAAPTAAHLPHRKLTRSSARFALRLAAVISALALFCVAIPVMAAQVLSEKSTATDTSDLLKPVLQFLSNETEPTSLSYPAAENFEKKPTYRALYSTVQKMLTEEQPPDVICLTELPKKLGSYQISLVYYGEKASTDKWRIHWNANDKSWGYLISYRNAPYSVELTKDFYTQKGYELCEANGRRYFCKVTESGTYTAKYIQGPILYSVTAPDYETLMLLLNHTAFASEIIPAATQQISLRSPEEYTELRSSIKNSSLLNYRVSYESTSEFANFERLNILAVDDAAEGLGHFTVTVNRRKLSATNLSEWTVAWWDVAKRWSVQANYFPENQEFRRAYYEATPLYTEQYVVNGRTFYITKVPLEPIDQPVDESQEYLVNYFEGNIIYSINVTGREMIDPLLNSLVMAQELAAK